MSQRASLGVEGGTTRREPPAVLYVTYCPVCGRNDLSMPLKARHSSLGKQCRGVLRQASYTRDSLDV